MIAQPPSSPDRGIARDAVSLAHLFWIFFRIGLVAWGGYMALVSVVRDQIVTRRRLIGDETLLDGVSLATLLPGPVAMNVVAFAGNHIAGRRGAIVAVTAVTLPSFLMVLAFSMAYLAWGSLPTVDRFFQGMLPAISAIILHAAWTMRGKALTRRDDTAVAVLAAVILTLVGGLYTTVAIIAGAAAYGILRSPKHSRDTAAEAAEATDDGEGARPADPCGSSWTVVASAAFLGLCLALFLTPADLFAASPLLQLFATFSGMSLTLFGGGFVFIPVIQEVVVDGFGWLNATEFGAAIAIGQITPGPILISATFIGYKVAGFAGAVCATLAMFMPPAVLMLTLAHVMRRIQHLAWVAAALAGIRAAVLGLIISAAAAVLASIEWQAGLSAVVLNIAIFGAAQIALMRLNVSALWILPVSGLAGALLV